MASVASLEYPDERTRCMYRTACVHWTDANYNTAVIKFIYLSLVDIISQENLLLIIIINLK